MAKINKTDIEDDEVFSTANASGSVSKVHFDYKEPLQHNSATPYRFVKYNELEILEELKHYIFRPLTKEPLRESILLQGVTDPLKVWEKIEPDGSVRLILYDGFTRHEIASEHPEKTIPLPILATKEFKTIDEVKYVMDQIQATMRRNLTDIQRTFSMGRAYNNIRKDHVVELLASRAKKSGRPELTTEVKEEGSTSRDIIAKEYGVNASSIGRAFDLYKGLSKIESMNKELYLTLIHQKEKVSYGDLELMGRTEGIPTELSDFNDLKEYFKLLKIKSENKKVKPSKQEEEFTKKSLSFWKKPTAEKAEELQALIQERLSEPKGKK